MSGDEWERYTGLQHSGFRYQRLADEASKIHDAHEAEWDRLSADGLLAVPARLKSYLRGLWEHTHSLAERIATVEAERDQLRDLLTKEYECAGLLYLAMDQLNVHHRDVHHHGGENMPSDATVIAGYRAWGMHLHIRPKVRELLGQVTDARSTGEAT